MLPEPLFPSDTPAAANGFTLDLPALRAQWRAQLALAGDLQQRGLDAWRQVADANLHFARQDSDALFYLWRALLRCPDPLQAMPLLARQVHPAAERLRAWHDQVSDALAGMQSDTAVLAQSYVPAARESAVAVVDELARLPGAAPLRALLH